MKYYELEKANNDITKFPRTLVFVKSRDYCEKLAFALSHSGIASQPLSGRRAQDLREKAFDALRSNEISVLLVTDLCARGIDIKDLDLVINYDMPHDYDTYIHRAGRVGRIRNGECVSYVSPENDRPLLMKIKEGMEKAGQIVPHSLEEILRSSEESQLENQREEDVSIKDADKKVEESVTKEEKKRETLEIAAFEEIKPPASSKTASEVPSEKQSGEFDVPKSSLEIPGEIKPVDVKVGVGSRKAAAEEDYDEW
uniref:Helicase C-terminal domain-containing protein n=1 Tax=Panagrolaimus davidi TaxID=227884 RepID=A0A914Q7G5_9BILA